MVSNEEIDEILTQRCTDVVHNEDKLAVHCPQFDGEIFKGVVVQRVEEMDARGVQYTEEMNACVVNVEEIEREDGSVGGEIITDVIPLNAIPLDVSLAEVVAGRTTSI
ncbi:uncharacterized protein A4U43_C09F11970 [Asparagus officinalis]|uniref:Uncharacterized protein n=1 Tax=Asparagus officinalis TaxID=4686 RepID=A0A5P1E757_ASPOF|nr:uncharacterized protein A4U43_C09F11970 [Asparagus officinalis]